MVDKIQTKDTEVVLGYPCEDSSAIEIPEGVCLEKPESIETVQVYPLDINKKLLDNLTSNSILIKLSSVIDLLICFIYVLGNNEVSGLLLALPLFGYCGAKYFHKGLVSIYAFYQLYGIGNKLYFMFKYTSMDTVIKLSLLCIFNLFILILISLFYIRLTKTTKVERKLLRFAINRPPLNT